ncbi:MAG: tetratricopeptide repeat protein [Proteobacteria bacterium]|nr:tetratricopeptide repeat protein [Pseudomonadota bacterium]
MALTNLQIQNMGRDAMQAAAGGDFATAERLLSSIAEAQPNAGQVQALLGQARLKLGRFADAREPLERGARFLPRDAAAQVNAAGCLMMLGAHAEALFFLDRAGKLKPGDAAILYNRGRCLEALGQLDAAGAAYDEALAIDHRLAPALSARAALAAARGDTMGALADLDMALTSRPEDAVLRLRRAALLLAQDDWLRGLPDYEARLDSAAERYAPDLPRWQGEPLAIGRLLVYPEQPEIDGEAAVRDTLMLARGLDGVDCAVQAGPRAAAWLAVPTIARGAALDDFVAAVPLRSLPFLLGWSPLALPPPPALKPAAGAGDRIGWFTTVPSPDGLAVERDPAQVESCRAVVGDDVAATHRAAALGKPTLLLRSDADNLLLGLRNGPSSWYASFEVRDRDDATTLAGFLARC